MNPPRQHQRYYNNIQQLINKPIMINVEQHETNTGWRGVFHCLPATRNCAHKIIMPLGLFHSPFLPEAHTLKATPNFCAKCKAILNPFSQKNKNTKTWICNFCTTSNPYTYDVGNSQVEQYLQGRLGDNGIFLVIDLCLPKKQLDSVKNTVTKVVQQLPNNIFIGLLAFNRNIFVYDFEDPFTKFNCLSGQQDYGPTPYNKLKENLGIGSTVDPKWIQKIINTRYYVLNSPHTNSQLVKAIASLKPDSYPVPRIDRQKRCTGAALQCAVGLLSDLPISTRFVTIIGGPCTIGLGKVVNLPRKNTIRSYVDIIQRNENIQHMATATTFYDNLGEQLVKKRHCFDLWAYGLDQFGLIQMKNIVSWTGGLLAMHEEFDHFIFNTSFEKFYEVDEELLMPYPISTTITLRVPKQLRINGLLAPGRTLKDNPLKLASDMEIGEGGTQVWYLGGISVNTSLCFIVSLSDTNVSENRERTGDIQAIINYKWSDNIIRTKVSTLRLEYLRENQIQQIGKRFDEEAGIVMLARMAAKKAQIQDTIQVKKWVDRILLKFAVRFASFTRNDRNSFKMPPTMRHLPQFVYHLRRSSFINPFGYPPDQAMYIKTCLLRQGIANCNIMIQPALIRYTSDCKAVPVQLDINELKEDVVLLLDSYFNVLVWYGQNVYSWKEDNLQNQPQYQYLQQFFQMPMQDASDIMYDRLPVSNFYQTFRNDGKERYLKSRVNPSKNKQVEDDGHFVSDDAPINLFMDYLVKSVINYNQ